MVMENHPTFSRGLGNHNGIRSYKPWDVGKTAQELRDMIYENVIATGHTSILRTSKALYKNMKPVVGKQGLYRVRIIGRSYWNDRYRYILQRQFPIAHRVQNIEIHIKDSRGIVYNVERSGLVSNNLAPIFHAVVDSVETPLYCRLKIESPYGDRVNAEALNWFQLLGVFRTVDVQVCPVQFYLLSVESGLSSTGDNISSFTEKSGIL